MRAFLFPMAVVLVLCSATFTLADLNDGLVLHYNLDTDEGGVVTDQSSYGNNGVVSGATWMADGPSGGAMSFDGDDYIRVPRDVSLEPDELTLAAWVRFDEVDGDVQGIIFKKNPNAQYHEDYDIMLIPEAYGQDFRFVVANTSGTQGDMDSTTQPGTGVWYHVVATFEQPNMKLYVNGVLESEETHNYPLHHDVTRDVFIGTKYAYNILHRFLTGDLDEVRIYNRALTGAEALQLYTDVAFPPPEEDLYISLVGFSNDPEGEQDVTDYLDDETVHIFLRDVDIKMDVPFTRALARIRQRGSRTVNVALALQEDGSYRGSISLQTFRAGSAMIEVFAVADRGRKRIYRSGEINITAAR